MIKTASDKKIAFVNNSGRAIKFDFDYEELDSCDVNLKNINKKTDLLKNYDFILIYDKKQQKGNGDEK